MPPTPTPVPNGWVLFLLCLVAAVLLIGLFWLNHYLRTGGESVNRYADDKQADPRADKQTDQTDNADRPSVSADLLRAPRLQLDRTKTGLIEVLVYNGWGASEVRALLKGDNAALGVEVEAARQKLGISPPERTLRVRDEAGERVIPL